MDGSSVVVLSHRLWQSRYAGDPEIVGRTILVNQFPLEVVGVMPASFTFPNEAMRAIGRGSADTQMWVPRAVVDLPSSFGGFTNLGIARLAPGSTPAEAARELNATLPLLTESFPRQPAVIAQLLDEMRLTAVVVPLKEHVVGHVQRALWVVFATVGFVLVVACANVANLFLVRAEGRDREVSVRGALGADRTWLLGFFLGESLILCGAGAALGTALAQAGVRALVRLGPESLPRLSTVTVGPAALLFAVVVTLLASVPFAAIPFLRSRSVRTDALATGRGAPLAGGTRLRARHILVTSQLALALVLLTGSALMLQSFRNLTRVDPGFDPSDDVLAFEMGLPRATFEGLEGVAAFYDELLSELGSLPGVEEVGGVSCLPLEGWCRGNPLAVAGRVDVSIPPVVALRRATEGYFDVAGIEILRGRALEPGDHRPGSRAAVISAELADLYFPRENPIGQRVFPGGAPSDQTRWFTVVGVVENIPAVSLSDPADPLIYFPVVGDPQELSILSLRFLVRANDALSLVPAIRQTIASINPTMALSGVRTLGGVKREASAQAAFTMVLLGIAASVAMLLGAIGIYGVLAYVVSQRSAEIGLRMALGARPAGVRRMILLHGGRLVGLGIVVGLAAAVALSRSLDSLLFDIAPTDPRTYLGVSMLLAVVAGAAIFLPARRAAGLDPIETLR